MDSRHTLDLMRFRSAALRVIVDTETDPAVVAGELSAVLDQETYLDDEDATTPWTLWKTGLAALKLLLEWDAAVRDASPDSDRFRLAAARKAKLANDGLKSAGFSPVPSLRDALDAIESVSDVRDVVAIRSLLAAVPLPLPVLAPRKQRQRNSTGETSHPLAVCVLELGGTPVTNAFVVEPNRMSDVGVVVRISDLQAWAQKISVEFLSVLKPTVVTVPEIITSPVPDPDEDGLRSVAGNGNFVIHVAQQFGASPLEFPVVVRAHSNDKEEVIPVGGYSSLRVRTFDPSRDMLAGQPLLDGRVSQMFSELRERNDVQDDEKEAFFRFFGAVVRAALRIQEGRRFPAGSNPSEADFQSALLDLLSADPLVAGQVKEKTAAGGGEVDLIFNHITCELKVERDSPASPDSAVGYIGQPVQYASGSGSQLSILCILDMTPKQSPVGALPNYITWLSPLLHGLTDPSYPALVGVVIVNGNQPLPSDWTRRRVGTVPDDS